jgi:hypothetical protein
MSYQQVDNPNCMDHDNPKPCEICRLESQLALARDALKEIYLVIEGLSDTGWDEDLKRIEKVLALLTPDEEAH